MKNAFRRAATVIAAAVLATGVYAQSQTFGSAPSVAPVGAAVAVTGGGVAAGSVVSIRVTAPSGTVVVSAVTADASGRFSHGVTAGMPGAHRIELLAEGGQLIADLRMMAVAAQ